MFPETVFVLVFNIDLVRSTYSRFMLAANNHTKVLLLLNIFKIGNPVKFTFLPEASLATGNYYYYEAFKNAKYRSSLSDTDLGSDDDPGYLYKSLQEKIIQKDEVVELDINSIMRLCTYVIPVIAILIVMFGNNDKNLTKHARQSLVTQITWLTVLAILNSTQLPIVTGGIISLASIWNVICLGLLILAGSKAYLGEFYKIPIIYEAARKFIEGN